MSKIGIYDSGSGGLSILKEVLSNIDGDVYYYGDSLNNPWGNKSKEDIYTYLIKISDWFKQNGVTKIITGCNTSLSFFENELESIFNQPVLNILNNSNANYKDKSYSVLLTENSYKNKLFSKLLRNKIIDEVACPNLANLIENNKIEEATKTAIKFIKQCRYENIILGCTHYPLIQQNIEQHFPSFRFINPATFINYKTRHSQTYPKIHFKVTGSETLFLKNLSNIIELETFVLNNKSIKLEQSVITS